MRNTPDVLDANEVAHLSCEHPGSNHSSDLIEVWSGRPTPRYVCGFHQSQELLD